MTQDKLKEKLSYDINTGIFSWRNNNKFCGNLNKTDGYIIIQINKKKYRAHRLAWLYVYGVWPKEFIDHINGIKNDNRLVNLREASALENTFNQKIKSNNTSGYKGVVWNKQNKKWVARIKVKGKYKFLGMSNDILIAANLYKNAAIELQVES